MRNLQPDILRRYEEIYARFINQKEGLVTHLSTFARERLTKEEAREAVTVWTAEMNLLTNLLEKSKTLIFKVEDVTEILADFERQGRRSTTIDMPYPSIFLQFSRPIPILESDKPDDYLEGVIVSSSEGYREDMQVKLNFTDRKDRLHRNQEGDWFFTLIAIPVESPSRMITRKFSGEGTLLGMKNSPGDMDPLYSTALSVLVGVCLEYVNQDNVILEVQEGAPEKANRKREREGKRRIEPYYLCKIVKVQPSETHATGEGAPHGFCYDVRGHYRHYKSGKVVKVKPHKRGVKHENYVPKTYVVERGVHENQ